MKLSDAQIDALAELLVGLQAKGVQRHVRDVDFWGAPYGTPLPLPPGFKKPKEVFKKRPKKLSPDKAKKARLKRLDHKDADPEVVEVARDITEIEWNGFTTKVNLKESSLENGVFWIAGDVYKDGKKVGFYQRVLDYETREMENAGLVLKPSVQGQGFAEHFYGHVEEVAWEQGMRNVRIFANIDVGGYAWSRRGFNFRDQAQRALFKDVVQMFADGEPGEVIELYGMEYTLTPSVIAQAQRLIRKWRSVTPLELSQLGERARSMRKVKRTRSGREVPMWPGKSLMLGSGWQGVKPLAKPRGKKDDVSDYMTEIERLIPYAESMFIPGDVFEPHKGDESDYNILGADLFYDPPLNVIPEQETKSEYAMNYGTYEEKGVRRVRDPEYWGVPYGTVIVPGMKPLGQMRLPGMPKPSPIVSAATDELRASRREKATVGYAREEAEAIRRLVRLVRVDYDSPEGREASRTLYNEYGISFDDLSWENPFASGGDWQLFGGCRDIRTAAYDILGYDVIDEEENVADPHLTSGGDPGWGQAQSSARAPYGYAYALLSDLNEADRVDIPLWRGVELYSYSNAKRFVEELQQDKTFDLPLASFAGRRKDAERFGDSVIFRVQPNARAVQGGFMGYDEDDERYYADDSFIMSEMVTGGRFVVVNVKEDSQGRFIVTIRQVATFNPDTGLATKKPNRRWKYASLFDNSLTALSINAVVVDALNSDTRSNKPSDAERGHNAR